jgi:arylsulfatase A-like enzyme
MRGNNHHGYTLDLTHQTLAEQFQSKGWATAAFVSAYPAGPKGGLDQGFAVFDGPTQGERPTSQTLKRAEKWLSEQSEKWFLWVHTYDPHGPYQGAETLGEKRAYAQEISASDTQIGPLAERVLAAGGAVVLTSDHGEVLDEEPCNWQHERSSSDTVFRIPLILAGPKVKPGVYTERVGITDLYATLLEMGGLAKNPSVDSHSLLDPKHREVWFAESGLCEPGCSKSCSPSGFLGKDRVVLGDAGRLVFRPGLGFVGTQNLRDQLSGYPAPEVPNQTANDVQGRALGYTD